MSLLARLTAPSKDRFAHLVMAELQHQSPQTTWTYNKANFSLSAPQNRVSFLDNAYAEYCQAQPWHRTQRLHRFCRSALADTEVPGHIINAEDHIVARVRETAFYHLCGLHFRRNGQEGVETSHRELTPSLSLEVVYDKPDSTQSITPEQLAGWKITLDKAIEIGIRNLKASTQKPMRETVPGFYEAPWDDDYDAARILLIDMIKELKVKGKAVALAPNKSTLVVTGSDDIDGLKRMLKVAQAAMQQPRLMTLIPLILENGHWTEYLPMQTHPLHADIKMLHIQSKTRDYGEQKELLESILTEDVFVATYQAFTTPTGIAYSGATWSMGVDSLLPVTEKVCFIDVNLPKEQACLGVADWHKVVEVSGAMMEPTDYFPPRYRVKSFPTPEMIKQMIG